MKPKKFGNKLALNKSTITNLSTLLPKALKARIKGGVYSEYPCEISAPQEICDSVNGYSCLNCGGTQTCGCTYDCSIYPCGISGHQEICNTGEC